MSTENIEVIPLGEDGELWFVTGTRDAHSAYEAARSYDMGESEGYGGSVLENAEADLVNTTYRTDWGWVPVDPDYPDDEEQLVHGREGVDPVAGFLVSA